MSATVDLYKELGLDRSWSENEIKSKLKELQKMWTRRQSACNDKEQLLNISRVLKLVEDAYLKLTKSLNRKNYDKELDEAYANGIIKDKTEEKLKTTLEQARQYYNKGNIKMAIELAQKTIDSGINNSDAYDLLAICYADRQEYNKALEIIDTGINIFKDVINLYWRGARVANISKQFDIAQKHINKLIELEPNSYIGYAEQIFMHLLNQKNKDLAFKEIDDYINKKPDDNEFKRTVANLLCSYSNTCFYYDPESDSLFIPNQESFSTCVKIREKAVEIYSDEFTQEQLKNAKSWGERILDDLNIKAIIFVSIYAFFLIYIFPFIGFLFLAFDALLVCFSYRPKWRILRTNITGKYEPLEAIVHYTGIFVGEFLAEETIFGYVISFLILVAILKSLF